MNSTQSVFAMAAVLVAGTLSAAEGPNRWALLIDVDDYTWARKLEYCGADMQALAEQLKSAGFPENQVYLLHDKAPESKYRPLRVNIETHLKLILGVVERGDIVVVGFSGHGVHLQGKSYLCPGDAKLDDPQSLVSLDSVYEMVQKSPAAFKLLLVDACRNDPTPGSGRTFGPTEGTRQFAASLEQPPQGILLLTSCAPGEIAREDPEFGHGVFMHYVLEGLKGKADSDASGWVSLVEVYKYANTNTKAYVARKFVDSQRPSLKGDIQDDFDLLMVPRSITAEFVVREENEKGILAPDVEVKLSYRASAGAESTVLGEAMTDTQGMVRITTVLTPEQQRGGEFAASVARAGTSRSWPLTTFPGSLRWNLYIPRNRPPSPLPIIPGPKPPRAGEVVVNSIGTKLAPIPAGEFLMGSPESEAERQDDEYQHRVRITKPFYLGVCEVTQGEYERVMGTNPSAFAPGGSYKERVSGQDTRRFPVENVSWEDAVEFCRKLSALPAERSAGRVYRLPTEAEWEYACRAGTTTPFHFGTTLNGREANCLGDDPYGTEVKGTSLERPTTVGSYGANGFGLYDMHGNVREWCQDWYDSDYYRRSPVDDPQGPTTASFRVFRGGCWYGYAWGCRAAFRFWFVPSVRDGRLGFRVALVPPGR